MVAKLEKWVEGVGCVTGGAFIGTFLLYEAESEKAVND
jgi:hypothetical protein